MGKTASCVAVVDGKARKGEALLETTELIFAPADRTGRVRVPFACMRKIAAGEALDITWKPEGKDGETAGKATRTISLALGAKAAAIWADKIKKPPGRLQKLGVKAGMKVAVWGPLEADALVELRARAEVHVGKPRGGEDIIFVAVDHPAELTRLAEARTRMAPAGAVWLVRKKGKDAPVSEAASMAAGKAAGLVDTKVAAFSATHTAERYVIPVAARAR